MMRVIPNRVAIAIAISSTTAAHILPSSRKNSAITRISAFSSVSHIFPFKTHYTAKPIQPTATGSPAPSLKRPHITSAADSMTMVSSLPPLANRIPSNVARKPKIQRTANLPRLAQSALGCHLPGSNSGHILLAIDMAFSIKGLLDDLAQQVVNRITTMTYSMNKAVYPLVSPRKYGAATTMIAAGDSNHDHERAYPSCQDVDGAKVKGSTDNANTRQGEISIVSSFPPLANRISFSVARKPTRQRTTNRPRLAQTALRMYLSGSKIGPILSVIARTFLIKGLLDGLTQ
ncbi:hypothetical protein PSACC_02502 [Paramicrosporidium saccamoebae]|uniref:Uncharacterized protein n=1 Tax=Paramicrosporidium saccamoebae TaxID=1246581 RepID=A0A2H9TIW6_9FUNG|nr:hypothetical protein PSACC_02502 [Paramicrosporidium saccamoebae]